jgi:hypothetical protein
MPRRHAREPRGAGHITTPGHELRLSYYETRAAANIPAPSREDATKLLGLPALVGHGYSRGDAPASVRATMMSPDYPEYLAEHLLLGVD